MSKVAKRQEFLARRKQLDASTFQRLSLLIQQRLVAAEVFREAETLALYSPINNEVKTDYLFSAALAEGKRVCYPRVCGGNLEFLAVNSVTDLVPGTFGVAEPVAGAEFSVSAIDLVVVPGVAFDSSGHRLGYGKGFYDRELAKASETTASVGLGYEFQLCGFLPKEVHDRSLDYLVTESRFISCRT